MSGSAAALVRKPPKPRDKNVRGTFEAYTRAKVVEMMVATRWAANTTRLLADVHRAAGAKAGVIAIVEAFTTGRILGPGDVGKDGRQKFSIHKGKVMDWSPNLITSDFAKLLGLSKRQCLKSLTWCVAEGLIERKGSKGEDRVRYRVNYEALRKAPNAMDEETVQKALEARVRAAEKRQDLEAGDPGGDGEDEADFQDAENKDSKEGGCGTRIPHVGVFVASGSGPKTVATFDGADGRQRPIQVDNALPIPATVTTTVTPDGTVVFKLSPVAPEPPTGGISVEPGTLGTADLDDFSLELVAAGYNPTPELIRKTLVTLGQIPAPYFLRKLHERNHQGVRPKPPDKRLPEGALPQWAAQVVGMWRMEERVDAGRRGQAAEGDKDTERITQELEYSDFRANQARIAFGKLSAPAQQARRKSKREELAASRVVRFDLLTAKQQAELVDGAIEKDLAAAVIPFEEWVKQRRE